MTTLGYPYDFDVSGRTATADVDEHVRDLIEQVLFTQPGERVNRPDFGCGVMQLVFAANSPELAAATQFLVQGALSQWLGDLIELQAVEVSSEEALLQVTVSYVVRRNGSHQVSRFERPGVLT